MTKVNNDDIYIKLLDMYPGLTPEGIEVMGPTVKNRLLSGSRFQTLDKEPGSR